MSRWNFLSRLVSTNNEIEASRLASWQAPVDVRQLNLGFKDRFEHIKIQAPPGANKTTGYILPQAIQDALSPRGMSVFMIDRKGSELYTLLSHIWRMCGHRVIYFDPWAPYQTWSFNPVQNADGTLLNALVEALVFRSESNDSGLVFYQDSTRRLLRNVLLACQILARERNDPRLASLPAAAQLVSRGSQETRLVLESVLPEEKRVSLRDFWEMKNNVPGIFSGLLNKLELFLDDVCASAFIRSDFTMADVVSHEDLPLESPRTLLIVGADQDKQFQGDILASLMASLFMHEAYARAGRMAAKGKSNTDVIGVNCVLDEIATYAVPVLPKALATMRSKGCSITLCFQDEQQLIQHYEQAGMIAISATTRTSIYLGGLSFETAKRVSDNMGTRKVFAVKRARGKSRAAFSFLGNISANETGEMKEVPLFTPDEIVNLPSDARVGEVHALVIPPRLRPTVVKLTPVYQMPLFVSAMKKSQQITARQLEANQLADNNNRSRGKGQPAACLAADINWPEIINEHAGPAAERGGGGPAGGGGGKGRGPGGGGPGGGKGGPRAPAPETPRHPNDNYSNQQYAEMMALQDEARQNKLGVQKMAQKRYGKSLNALTYGEMADLIGHLKELAAQYKHQS